MILLGGNGRKRNKPSIFLEKVGQKSEFFNRAIEKAEHKSYFTVLEQVFCACNTGLYRYYTKFAVRDFAAYCNNVIMLFIP